MHDLIETLSRALKEKGIKLVTAESCTGGLLAAAITHKPGASDIFDCGFITYTNQSKMNLLGVPEVVLSSFGAVSGETAEAMAKGALKNSNAALAVSITGIAGPGGGTDKKPVGTVFFGYALKNGSTGSIECHFKGNREQIRTAAATNALEHLLTVLESPNE
jgi:nicotinamide-nucleotide amidase